MTRVIVVAIGLGLSLSCTALAQSPPMKHPPVEIPDPATQPRPNFTMVLLRDVPIKAYATRKEAEDFVAANSVNGHAKNGSSLDSYKIVENPKDEIMKGLWYVMEKERIRNSQSPGITR